MREDELQSSILDFSCRTVSWISVAEQYPGFQLQNSILDFSCRTVSWISVAEQYPGFQLQNSILDFSCRTVSWISVAEQYPGFQLQNSILDFSCRRVSWILVAGRVSCSISSSVESDSEGSDNDGVNGRDEEATPHLGSRAEAGHIEE